MPEILAHYLFRHAILWDTFLHQLVINSLFSEDFAYFDYARQGGSITSEHWLTDTLFTYVSPYKALAHKFLIYTCFSI